MWIFHAVQYDQELRSRQHLLQLGVIVRGAKGHNPLMRSSIRSPIQRFPGLEAHRDGALPRQINYFLKPGPPNSARDEHAVQYPLCPQRFLHRMNADQNIAYGRFPRSLLLIPRSLLV